MAKKKDNSKRNLALGTSVVIAGGVALKSGKLGKIYNSVKRTGKKRGKYKTKVNPPESNSTILNPKTKAEKSALIQQRQQRIKNDEYFQEKQQYSNILKSNKNHPNKKELLEKSKLAGKVVKYRVDRARKLNRYSKQLYLISDFSLYE